MVKYYSIFANDSENKFTITVILVVRHSCRILQMPDNCLKSDYLNRKNSAPMDSSIKLFIQTYDPCTLFTYCVRHI